MGCASLEQLVDSEIMPGEVRIISGSVLSGTKPLDHMLI